MEGTTPMTETKAAAINEMNDDLNAKIAEVAEREGRTFEDVDAENRAMADEAGAVGNMLFAVAKQLTPSPTVAVTAFGYALMRTIFETAKNKEAALSMWEKINVMNRAGLEKGWDAARGKSTEG